MHYIFSIYDSAAGFYKTPFACDNKGVALREFADACNNTNSFLGKHPSDYTLFLVGTFDDDKGMVIPELTPIRLGTAIEFVKKVESQEVVRGSVATPRADLCRDDVN